MRGTPYGRHFVAGSRNNESTGIPGLMPWWFETYSFALSAHGCHGIRPVGGSTIIGVVKSLRNFTSHQLASMGGPSPAPPALALALGALPAAVLTRSASASKGWP